MAPSSTAADTAPAIAPALTRAEIDALGHTFAYEVCVGYLDSNSFERMAASENSAGDWIEVTWMDVNAEDIVEGGELFDCVRYLDARGLLVRHPEYPTWLRVRDESEAAR